MDRFFWHSLDQKAVVQGSQYNGIHTARCLRGALPLCLTRSSQKWMHDSWNIAFAGLVCVSLFLDGVAQWRFGECSSKLTNTSRGLGWDSLLPRPLVTCCGGVSSSFAYAFESVLAHRGCGTEGWVLNLIGRMVRTVVPANVWSISSTLWGSQFHKHIWARTSPRSYRHYASGYYSGKSRISAIMQKHILSSRLDAAHIRPCRVFFDVSNAIPSPCHNALDAAVYTVANRDDIEISFTASP